MKGDAMMNRRSLLTGAIALASSLLPVAGAFAAIAAERDADPAFVINQWTAGKRVPQILRRSEILEAEYLYFPNHQGEQTDWVQVVRTDHRVFQSELSQFQDVAGLVRQLVDAGVPVKVLKF